MKSRFGETSSMWSCAGKPRTHTIHKSDVKFVDKRLFVTQCLI